MRNQLTLAERVRMLRELLANIPVTMPENGAPYQELELEALLTAGFPISSKNPAYWSGTMPGLRAAIILGKVTMVSRKHQIIRFRDISAKEKLVWAERLARTKQRTLLSQIIDEDGGTNNVDEE